MTHSSFLHLSFAYSSPASFIMTSEKVKTSVFAFSLPPLCVCVVFTVSANKFGDKFLKIFFLTGVSYTCGTVGNKLKSIGINY